MSDMAPTGDDGPTTGFVKRALNISGWSVSLKLTVIITATAALALMVAAALFLTFQHYTLRQSLIDDSLTIAEITGLNVSAPLIFGDQAAAQETLQALSAHQSIISATLFNQEGTRFALYLRPGKEALETLEAPPALGVQFLKDILLVSRPILIDEEKIGAVVLMVSLDKVWRHDIIGAFMVLLMVALSLIGAMILSLRLQRMVSDPLSDLVQTAREITLEKDYGIRALRKSDDDFGALVDTFNEMLDEIQDRDNQLQRHYDELEKTVVERTAELFRAKELAEESNRLKDKFVSLVSHDLRSPIASAIVYLRRLKINEEAEDAETQRALLSRSEQSLHGMLEMIDSLLDINRLQSGDIKLKKGFESAAKITELVKDSLAPLAEEKQVAIQNRIPGGVRIYADSRLFEELVRNLVSNAIKFTPVGGQVTISVDPDEAATLVVADNGVGMSPEILENLFKKEIKTTTVGTAGERGSGLGLLFCNDIMMAHEGTLDVVSSPGEGAAFYARFPHIIPRVLLVDDQEIVRASFRKRLATLGVEVEEAEDGQQALDRIKDATPHLIIADIQMPVMDGFRFLEALKANTDYADIPVIVATSLAGVEVREKVFQMGADDYISKPVLDEDLIPRVRRFVG